MRCMLTFLQILKIRSNVHHTTNIILITTSDFLLMKCTSNTMPSFTLKHKVGLHFVHQNPWGYSTLVCGGERPKGLKTGACRLDRHQIGRFVELIFFSFSQNTALRTDFWPTLRLGFLNWIFLSIFRFRNWKFAKIRHNFECKFEKCWCEFW